jgi:hypothetical protein
VRRKRHCLLTADCSVPIELMQGFTLNVVYLLFEIMSMSVICPVNVGREVDLHDAGQLQALC